eukprot:99959-Alexandrium_andersonii.AAC.1
MQVLLPLEPSRTCSLQARRPFFPFHVRRREVGAPVLVGFVSISGACWAGATCQPTAFDDVRKPSVSTCALVNKMSADN